MVKSELLYYLQAIYNFESVSLAAENLYMTQAALSAAVKRFENEIGAALIYREGGKTKLTIAAQRILNLAGDSVQCLNKIDLYISSLRKGNEGKKDITLAFSSQAADALLSNYLMAFKRDMPQICGVDVELEVCEGKKKTVEYVESHENCIGFCYYFAGDVPELSNIHAIYDEKLYLRVNKQTKFIKLPKESISLQELANVPIVLHGDTNSYYKKVSKNLKYVIDKNKSPIVVESYVKEDMAMAIALGTNLNSYAKDDNAVCIKIEGFPRFSLYAFASKDFEINLYKKIVNYFSAVLQNQLG